MVVLTVMTAVLAAVLTIVTLCYLNENTSNSGGPSRPLEGKELEECRTVRKGAWRWARICAVSMVMFMFGNAAVPDRNTVLLIAASEIGERVATSQRVDDILDPSIELLKTWMEQQTAAIRKDMAPAPAPAPARAR